MHERGKADSVQLFAPMAIAAYGMIDKLDLDQRYDLGRIAEVAGAFPLARAQADTILAGNPSHLLGLILAARIASIENRPSDRQGFEARLLKSYPSESAKKLPEYERHAADITGGLESARRTK